MSDERTQKAVMTLLLRLIGEAGDGEDFQRALLQAAGLLGAFYIEYMRAGRKGYQRTKLSRGHRRLRHLLTEEGKTDG